MLPAVPHPAVQRWWQQLLVGYACLPAANPLLFVLVWGVHACLLGANPLELALVGPGVGNALSGATGAGTTGMSGLMVHLAPQVARWVRELE